MLTSRGACAALRCSSPALTADASEPPSHNSMMIRLHVGPHAMSKGPAGRKRQLTSSPGHRTATASDSTCTWEKQLGSICVVGHPADCAQAMIACTVCSPTAGRLHPKPPPLVPQHTIHYMASAALQCSAADHLLYWRALHAVRGTLPNAHIEYYCLWNVLYCQATSQMQRCTVIPALSLQSIQ